MYNKQLFILGMPAEDLLIKVSKYPAHVFAADMKNNALIANELHANFFGIRSVDNFIGKNYFDLIYNKTEADLDALYDTVAINSNIPQLFYETCLGSGCYCIKARLLDSNNKTIGVGGLVLHLNQISFQDIASLINEFVYLQSVTDKLAYHYINNKQHFHKLSSRERECVNCLTKSMTCKETAKALNISYRTVEKHIENIRNKLGCCSRSDIVNMVFEHN